MGTVPGNYPPENGLPIGGFLTGNKLQLTAGLPSTVFFTAPTTGLYQIAVVVRILSTDGAGTLQYSYTPPHGPPVGGNATAPAVNGDIGQNSRSQWFNAGDTITLTVSAVGLGATVYSVYLTAARIF